MTDNYGLDAVSRYDGQIIGTLPPHLFAVGASAYHRLLAKGGENQVGCLFNCCCCIVAAVVVEFVVVELVVAEFVAVVIVLV